MHSLTTEETLATNELYTNEILFTNGNLAIKDIG
jgi:hypothetical protein